MPQTPDLKQQLLRQAVAENLSTITGQHPAAERSMNAGLQTTQEGPERRRRARLATALVTALVGVGLLLWVGQGVNESQNDATPPSPMATPVDFQNPVAANPQAPRAFAIDPEELKFSAPQPIESEIFPLAVRRLVLDPGHGGEDLGTVSGQLTEKDLTLDIAQRLKRHLESASFEVLMTRDDDRALSLKERALLANNQRADIFVSIHINWIEVRKVRGVETYFLGPTDDPELKELARRENRESGYSLADLRSLLEGIYADVRQDESRHLASRVQRSLFHSLRQVNPELQDRGVKTAPFVVLVATDMPAILAEVSCLSNQEEAELLSRPLYREHIAEALFRGVTRFARDVNQIEEKGS